MSHEYLGAHAASRTVTTLGVVKVAYDGDFHHFKVWSDADDDRYALRAIDSPEEALVQGIAQAKRKANDCGGAVVLQCLYLGGPTKLLTFHPED